MPGDVDRFDVPHLLDGHTNMVPQATASPTPPTAPSVFARHTDMSPQTRAITPTPQPRATTTAPTSPTSTHTHIPANPASTTQTTVELRANQTQGYGGSFTTNPPPPPMPATISPRGLRAAHIHGFGGSYPTTLPGPQPTIARPPLRKGVRGVTRGSGFSQVETDNLLDCIEMFLPLCKEQWDVVFLEHNKKFGYMDRTVDSLKRKFSVLHRKKMPTGDPLMPPDVRRAKHLRFRMTDRANLGVAEEAEIEADHHLPPSIAGQNADVINGLPTSPRSLNNLNGQQCSAFGAEVLPTSPPSNTQTPPANTSTPPSITPTPRSIFNHGRSTTMRNGGSGDLIAIIKASMLQEQTSREEEVTRRREDSRVRAEEREEKRKRREEERDRREQERQIRAE